MRTAAPIPARGLRRPIALLTAAALAPLANSAGESSAYERTWSRAELYKDAGNPAIQSVAFTGRYQLDYAFVRRNDFEELATRRWRMGTKIRAFRNFTLHAEADFDPEGEPWYQKLTDAYIAWSRSKALTLTVGKHSAGFTMDGMTSSKELLTIDRSNLTNNLWFTQEYMPGISAAGRTGNWRYHAGLYSAGRSTKEFGRFDGSYFALYTLGYDFASRLGVKTAALTGHYVFQNPNPRNTFTRNLHHIGSLSIDFEAGKSGVRADLSGATGTGSQSDLWGAMIMPYYNLSQRLQLVLRYTYLNSAGEDGVVFGRYESLAVGGRGDNYNEYYAGLNYYFYGHKLKLQSGLQHVDMDDTARNGGSFSGWAWTTGFRVSW